jgi:DNA-binding MarR family transcriptional regulator
MNDPLERARWASVRAIGVMDPFRLRFWDSRGVTMTQLRVMHLIRERCEPSTGELAEELHIRPATLTGLADRLESKGFIRRWPDAADRRVVRVGLTDEGSELLDEAYALGRRNLDAIFERMGADAVEEFSRAVQRFIETAEAVHVELPRPEEPGTTAVVEQD